MPNVDLEMIANASYAILLISYIMRDILWLRVLTVISLGFEIPYFYFQSQPLWDGISWDVAFILINVYWIGRLAYDRRPVHLTDDQKRIWKSALHRLHPRHARVLFKLGKVKTVAPNETIAKHGETLHEVSLISEGKVEIRLNNKKIEDLGPGHFVGTASFLERDLEFPTVTDALAVEPTRMITWNKNQLRKLAESDHQLGTAVEATLAMDVVSLLARAWKRESKVE